MLDEDVGLDARAAEALIQHRNGWDMTHGTPDDNPFDSISEVDNVPFVGPVALTRLKNFAMEWGWNPNEDDYMGTWSEISFTWAQAAITLEFVNGCSLKELDVDLGLDQRAANNIIGSLPLGSINQLANIHFVGKKTLKTLRDVSMAFHAMEDSAPIDEGMGMEPAEVAEETSNTGIQAKL